MFRKVTLQSLNRISSVGLLLRRFSSSPSGLSLCELGRRNLVFTEKDAYIMKSPYGAISIPDETIDRYVWKDISKWPNHIAIECGITGRKYNYSKLRDHCAAFAIRLRRHLKLQKNDIISICLPNVPGKWMG